MRLLQLRITRIVQETGDTKSFYLEPVDHSAISYKAGQFLTLLFNDNQRETRRSYSIGSTPLVDESIFITVKRKPNGAISRRLHDHYNPGDILTTLAPSGRFLVYEPLSPVHFFIAGGSGITPIFSLIKALLFHHRSTKVILINQCRSENDIIYKTALLGLQERFKDRFEIFQFLSRPSSRSQLSLHLNNEILERIIKERNKDIDSARFYICGPLPFMRMAEFTLRLIGMTDDQIRKEHFVIDRTPPQPLLSDRSPKEITIHLMGRTHQFNVSFPSTILDAASQQGLELPYSCKAGRCGTCTAYCIHGKIIMSTNEVLTERDLAKGLVLLCVGYAATNAEIVVE